MAADPILTPACELAFEVARDGVEGWPVQEPPPPMRSFLYVARLPRRALTVAQRAIEEDADFRARVAERATEQNVGRAGWLWLQRPEGWEGELSALTGGAYGVSAGRVQPAGGDLSWSSDSDEPEDALADPVPAEVAAVGTSPTESAVQRVLSSDIERELDGLRSLVDRLADERRAVTSSVQQLESEVEQRRTESSQLSAHLDSLRGELRSLRAERDQLAGALAQVEQQLVEERSGGAGAASLRRELDAVLADNIRLRDERDRLAELQHRTSEAQQGLLAELSGHLERLQAEREAIQVELDRSNVQLTNARELFARAANEATEQLDRDVIPSLGSAGEAARLLQGAVDEAVDHLERLRGTLDRAVLGADDTTSDEPGPADDPIGPAPDEPTGLVDSETGSTWGFGEPPEAGPVAAWDHPLLDEAVEEAGPAEPVEETASAGVDEEWAGLADSFDEPVVAALESDWEALLDEAPAEPAVEAPPADEEPAAGGSDTSGVEEEAPRSVWEDRAAEEELVRRPIEVPAAIRHDELEAAKYVVRAADVVLLVDGDQVASTGWPTLDVAERRDALVAYLADLEADTGAAPDVVFDVAVGDQDTLPRADSLRIRLTAPGVGASLAIGQLIDTYPVDWPVVVISDDPALLELAPQHGAGSLSPLQLLDLFIAQ
jgi:hypothetical protein